MTARTTMTDWDKWDAHLLRLARKERRESYRRNPGFARAIRRMSDDELDALAVSVGEQELTRLRWQPNFDRNPAAQSQAASLEYELRLIRERRMWRAHPAVKPGRLARKPFNPRFELAPDAPPEQQSSVRNPAPPVPGLGSAETAPPASVGPELAPSAPPDNVVPFRAYAKAFGTGGRELGYGHPGPVNDYDIW